MTDFEKLIYNRYLAETRMGQGRPYKLRQNFDKVDESTKLYLTRLSNFFNKHKNINLNKFFKAPYKIYKDKPHLGLDFYLSMKAIKLYREYINACNRQSPDSDDAKLGFRQSMAFVINFCKDNQIKFSDYINYKEENSMNAFFDHLKHGKVTLLFLFMYPAFESQLKTVDVEIRQHILGDIFNDIAKMRVKFYNCSEKTKSTFKQFFDSAVKVMG
jgi:hypothetical protein